MRALAENQQLSHITRIKAELFGSLGATGRGHESPKAVMLGLESVDPEFVEVDAIPARMHRIQSDGSLLLNGEFGICFNEPRDLVLHRRKSLPAHPNGMVFTAFDREGAVITSETYYSVGGGFVVNENAASHGRLVEDTRSLVYPFNSAEELLSICESTGLPVSGVMIANESAWWEPHQTRAKLLEIWSVMKACTERGCSSEGILPGGLQVPRRAPALLNRLSRRENHKPIDPLEALDWVSLYALAVNEENAAGGRVVTAPTNGAAGIVPAVLHYYDRFVPGADEDGVVRFLLTAGAIGILVKKNASISGAEVGCQGEVGSACAMAAGGLAEVLGGSPAQVENAAEIAMEHNLGLTCDPIGGLVQVPCIERNAMASVKAIHAARMALKGDGKHFVSLDKVIRTMRETGQDMKDKYKETARGGLAVNVIEC